MRRLAWRVIGAFLILAVAGLTAAPVAIAAERGVEAKIDINAAEVDELADLPGIGPAYAQRIVEYREKHGPFGKIEDLLNVRGIGDRKFEKLRDRVTVKKR